MDVYNKYPKNVLTRLLLDYWKDIADLRAAIEGPVRLNNEYSRLLKIYKGFESIEEECDHILTNIQDRLRNSIDNNLKKSIIDNRIELKETEQIAFEIEQKLVQLDYISR